MDKEKLQEAINEAERFIKAAKQVGWKTINVKGYDGEKDWSYKEITHTEAAATKRASLDLTRALARLRSR